MNDDIVFPLIFFFFLALLGLLIVALIVALFVDTANIHSASMACIDRGGYYIREAGICIPAGVEVAK